MPNIVPYLILAVMSMIALAVLWYYQRSASLLILLLSFAGMIYVFEFFIFVLYDSYTYYPHIIRTSYYDNVLGAIGSNLLSVPIGALYIAVYQLRWPWIAGLALLYGGIELLFLWLGVYEHHWWNTVFTVFSLLIFFKIAQKWPVWLSGRSRAIKFITLVMFAWSVVATMVYALAVSHFRIFHIGFFEDPYRDDIFFSAMYGFFKSVVLAAAVTVTRRAWLRASGLLVILALHLVLMRLGILKISLPLWQYWSIYAPCCIIVLWLVAVSYGKLERFKA